MQDYLTLGPTPAAEDCAQVGAEDYHQEARAECRRYVAGLLRHFGEPPAGAAYTIKRFPHDFGSYLEVCITYDEDSAAAIDYAFHVENEAPSTWEELEA